MATARGYDARACQNRQPVLFHRHPGQTYSKAWIRKLEVAQNTVARWLTGTSSRSNCIGLRSFCDVVTSVATLLESLRMRITLLKRTGFQLNLPG